MPLIFCYKIFLTSAPASSLFKQILMLKDQLNNQARGQKDIQ